MSADKTQKAEVELKSPSGETVYCVEGGWGVPIIFSDPDEACSFFKEKPVDELTEDEREDCGQAVMTVEIDEEASTHWSNK